MCDLENGLISTGQLPFATIDNILRQHGMLSGGDGFGAYFLLSTSWTGNQLAEMARDSLSGANPYDFMPLALVYASKYSIDQYDTLNSISRSVSELSVDGDLRAGYYAAGKTLSILPIQFCAVDQSAAQTVALNCLADRLREDFKDAAATYSVQ